LFARNQILTIAALLLSSCANKQVVLTPPATVYSKQDEIHLLTVSTRAESDVPGLIYSGERSDTVTVKAATVAIPLNHQPGELSFSYSGEPNPDEDFAVTHLQSLQEGEVPNWLAEEEHTNRVFIFVHGYNVDFGSALYSLAQLSYDLKVEAIPVLFSWPSRGKLNSYIYDKESATLSRDTLEKLLQYVVDSEHIDEVTVLAHSMGSWIAVEALRQMAIRNGGDINPKISDVILASPDIDVDVFESQMSVMTGTRPFFTFIVSKDDRALGLSRILAGDVDRVGNIDVNAQRYQEIIESIDDGILVIDSTELKTRNKGGHFKYAESPLVLTTLSTTISELTGEFADISLAASVLLSLSQTLENSEETSGIDE
jgi:esterase/lipase superfamily enzyme